MLEIVLDFVNLLRAQRNFDINNNLNKNESYCHASWSCSSYPQTTHPPRYWTRNYHYRSSLVWTRAIGPCLRTKTTYSPRYWSRYHHYRTPLVWTRTIGPRLRIKTTHSPRYWTRNYYYWSPLVRTRATRSRPKTS